MFAHETTPPKIVAPFRILLECVHSLAMHLALSQFSYYRTFYQTIFPIKPGSSPGNRAIAFAWTNTGKSHRGQGLRYTRLRRLRGKQSTPPIWDHRAAARIRSSPGSGRRGAERSSFPGYNRSPWPSRRLHINKIHLLRRTNEKQNQPTYHTHTQNRCIIYACILDII